MHNNAWATRPSGKEVLCISHFLMALCTCWPSISPRLCAGCTFVIGGKRFAQRSQSCTYCARRDADRFGYVLAVCRAIRNSTGNRSTSNRPGWRGDTGTSAQFGHSRGEYFCGGRIVVCDCAVGLAGTCRQNAAEGNVRDLRCLRPRLRPLLRVADHRGTLGGKIGGPSGRARSTLMPVTQVPFPEPPETWRQASESAS